MNKEYLVSKLMLAAILFVASFVMMWVSKWIHDIYPFRFPEVLSVLFTMTLAIIAMWVGFSGTHSYGKKRYIDLGPIARFFSRRRKVVQDDKSGFQKQENYNKNFSTTSLTTPIRTEYQFSIRQLYAFNKITRNLFPITCFVLTLTILAVFPFAFQSTIENGDSYKTVIFINLLAGILFTISLLFFLLDVIKKFISLLPGIWSNEFWLYLAQLTVLLVLIVYVSLSLNIFSLVKDLKTGPVSLQAKLFSKSKGIVLFPRITALSSPSYWIIVDDGRKSHRFYVSKEQYDSLPDSQTGRTFTVVFSYLPYTEKVVGNIELKKVAEGE